MISIYSQHIAFQNKYRTGIIYDQGQFVHASQVNPSNTLAPFRRMYMPPTYMRLKNAASYKHSNSSCITQAATSLRRKF